MTGLSLGAAHAIAEKFPWADYKSFADIGTAQGGLAVELARAHSHLNGIGFDLPVVRPHFEAYARSTVSPRGFRSRPATSSRRRCRRRMC